MDRLSISVAPRSSYNQKRRGLDRCQFSSGARPAPLGLRWRGGFAAFSKKGRAAKWRRTAMNEADSDTIEERLARLERGVKRGKRATTATMVLLVLLIAWSFAARSGKVRAADSGTTDLLARSLTIVDEKGNLGVALVATKDGPRVALLDQKGRPRISLGVYKNGPSVGLSDEKGHPASLWES